MTQFTVAEWKRIEDELTANRDRYGFPQREYGSVLLGSFNVRKLGEFLARICPLSVCGRLPMHRFPKS